MINVRIKPTKVLLLSGIIISLVILLSLSVAALKLPPGVQKLAEYQNQLAANITLLIAFIAGLVTFTSPCGFALLPTYLAFAFKNRKESLYMTSAFSIGLIIAFVLFGIIGGYTGEFFNRYKLGFSIFSGTLLFMFGILLFLNKGFFGFNFENRLAEKKTFLGMSSVGFFFGAAWTPCIGPVLLGIILLAANTGNILASVSLLVAYALGVVLPLLIISFFSDKYDFSNSRFIRSLVMGKSIHFTLFNKKIETHTYNIFGGIILMILALLIIFYRGTFFFQTTLTKYVPWSMSLWSYLNDTIIWSKVLGSKVLNIFAGFLLLSVATWLVYVLIWRKEIRN